MTEKRIKRPRDPFQFAKLIGDIATGQVEDVALPSKADERAGSVCLNSFVLEISGLLPGFLGWCDALLGCNAGRAWPDRSCVPKT